MVGLQDGLDLSPLLPSLAACSLSDADLRSLQKEVKVKVAWSLSSSGNAQGTPSRSLLLPTELAQVLGE